MMRSWRSAGGQNDGIGWLDDDRAVQPHLEPEVLADVRVIPVEPGVGELNLVRERAPDRDRRLRLMRNAVVAVLQPKAVPVDRRLDIAIVAHLHRDLRPLIHVQGRAGDRTVVAEHPQLRAIDALAHGRDPKVEPIAVVEPDQLWWCRFGQPSGLGRE